MNIAEIARLAGVSSAAVSRYFNNGYISEEKREAIRRVVEETGYRPLAQARMLRTRKTMQVGVIVPKAASSAVGRVIEGILTVLDRRGYRVLLAVTRNDPGKELEYLKAFDEGQVDGIILAATVFTEEHKKTLETVSVPVVIVGQRLEGYCCIFHDDYHAIYDVTVSMIRSGRKKLGYIGVTLDDQAAGKERLRGFQDAVSDSNLEELRSHYVIASFSEGAGHDKAEELLEKYPDLDGIVCATDEIAAGTLRRLREMKMEDRVLLSGVGDSDLASAAGENLITIHFSYEESGELAADSLLAIIDEEEPAAGEVRLGYTVL